MTHVSYFEIGGHVIQLDAENLTTPGSYVQRRTQEKIVRQFKGAKVEVKKKLTSNQSGGMGPAEEFLTGAGLGLGVAFAIMTSPLTLLDGPLPVADAAWFAAAVRFTYYSTTVGNQLGQSIDEKMGWD